MIFIFYLSCQRESKSKEYIIENEIAYPMSQDQVIKKIGLPDSVSTEDYDTGSFGKRKREIYHYGRHQLIFSHHGIYKGLKSK
ncbi:hypothetical protein BFP75_02480 [Maribacter sp. 4G9]|nr:hypothetical protein BFP75_02480 [Maribacter sp. 4G9]